MGEIFSGPSWEYEWRNAHQATLKQTMQAALYFLQGQFSWRRLGNVFHRRGKWFCISSHVAQVPNNNESNPSRGPVSTNVLSHWIKNVYGVGVEVRVVAGAGRDPAAHAGWPPGCHWAACPALTQLLDTGHREKLLVWTRAKAIGRLLMELLLMTRADTHLLSREALPDPRRPADHCCLWPLAAAVNSPTQAAMHASLPACLLPADCSQGTVSPSQCVCVHVCVHTLGPVLKGRDNRWWLQVIQTTAKTDSSRYGCPTSTLYTSTKCWTPNIFVWVVAVFMETMTLWRYGWIVALCSGTLENNFFLIHNFSSKAIFSFSFFKSRRQPWLVLAAASHQAVNIGNGNRSHHQSAATN